jgi:hypothetical protein
VCGKDFFSEDPHELQTHVETHFAAAGVDNGESEGRDLALAREIQRRETEAERWREAQEFAALQAQYGMQQDDQGNNFAAQADTSMRRAVAKGELSVTDYYERAAGAVLSSRTGLDDGSSRTGRVTLTLAGLSAKSPGVRVTHLASPPVDHFAANFGDKGWGCGYRNIQMMLSSLFASSHYRDALENVLLPNGSRSSNNLTENAVSRGPMPSIPRLQWAIEAAWQRGFDRAGADQLGGKLTDTRKWIGATEVYTLLTSCGLDTTIVDFHRPTGEGASHPLLFEWVWDYFSSRTGGTIQSAAMGTKLSGSPPCRPPLYLQHQGHSRTIVGVERLSNGALRLLVLDPSTPPTAIRYW